MMSDPDWEPTYLQDVLQRLVGAVRLFRAETKDLQRIAEVRLEETLERAKLPPLGRDPLAIAAVRRFLRHIHVHSSVLRPDVAAHERVPEGARFVGRLYITAGGEIAVADGSPADEERPLDDPLDAHNCDEMGCGSVSHVVARLDPIHFEIAVS